MLVSIIIATYNCSLYIEDALNSVFNQTYKNVELIVTDDCSTDDSVKVATNWIESHRGRFQRVIQTQTKVNSGVTANYNAGLREAKGEWVKCLDGDDILPNNAIDIYVQRAKSSPDINLWYANEQLFKLKTKLNHINYTTLPNSSAKKQMIYLLNRRLLGICTATNFIHKDTFLHQGGFDSRFPMYQDGSPFLQSLANGNRIGVINETLLYKRLNPDSLMHTANPIMVENIRECHFYYSRYYIKYCMPLHYYNSWLTHYLSTHNNSSKSQKCFGYFLRCFDLINLLRKCFPNNQSINHNYIL